MHSGTEDGGVSKNKSYTFVAKADIVLPNVLYHYKPMKVMKGDSVIFQSSSYQPYNQPALEPIVDTTNNAKDQSVQQEKKYEANKVGDHVYVFFTWSEDWSLARTYLYNNEKFVAVMKEEFDRVEEHFAP